MEPQSWAGTEAEDGIVAVVEAGTAVEVAGTAVEAGTVVEVAGTVAEAGT